MPDSATPRIEICQDREEVVDNICTFTDKDIMQEIDDWVEEDFQAVWAEWINSNPASPQLQPQPDGNVGIHGLTQDQGLDNSAQALALPVGEFDLRQVGAWAAGTTEAGASTAVDQGVTSTEFLELKNLGTSDVTLVEQVEPVDASSSDIAADLTRFAAATFEGATQSSLNVNASESSVTAAQPHQEPASQASQATQPGQMAPKAGQRADPPLNDRAFLEWAESRKATAHTQPPTLPSGAPLPCPPSHQLQHVGQATCPAGTLGGATQAQLPALLGARPSPGGDTPYKPALNKTPFSAARSAFAINSPGHTPSHHLPLAPGPSPHSQADIARQTSFEFALYKETPAELTANTLAPILAKSEDPTFRAHDTPPDAEDQAKRNSEEAHEDPPTPEQKEKKSDAAGATAPPSTPDSRSHQRGRTFVGTPIVADLLMAETNVGEHVLTPMMGREIESAKRSYSASIKKNTTPISREQSMERKSRLKQDSMTPSPARSSRTKNGDDVPRSVEQRVEEAIDYAASVKEAGRLHQDPPAATHLLHHRALEVSGLKLEDLRDHCQEMGLRISGSKRERIRRILTEEYRRSPAFGGPPSATAGNTPHTPSPLKKIAADAIDPSLIDPMLEETKESPTPAADDTPSVKKRGRPSGSANKPRKSRIPTWNGMSELASPVTIPRSKRTFTEALEAAREGDVKQQKANLDTDYALDVETKAVDDSIAIDDSPSKKAATPTIQIAGAKPDKLSHATKAELAGDTDPIAHPLLKEAAAATKKAITDKPQEARLGTEDQPIHEAVPIVGPPPKVKVTPAKKQARNKPPKIGTANKVEATDDTAKVLNPSLKQAVTTATKPTRAKSQKAALATDDQPYGDPTSTPKSLLTDAATPATKLPKAKTQKARAKRSRSVMEQPDESMITTTESPTGPATKKRAIATITAPIIPHVVSTRARKKKEDEDKERRSTRSRKSVGYAEENRRLKPKRVSTGLAPPKSV